MSSDDFQNTARDMTAPAEDAVPVVADVSFAPCRSLYVGTAGDLVVVMARTGTTRTFKNAAAGYHPLRVTKVTAASTAADIQALY